MWEKEKDCNANLTFFSGFVLETMFDLVWNFFWQVIIKEAKINTNL